MEILFPEIQTTLQDCECKNTYVDADYVVKREASLETKMNIVQEFREELNPEVIDLKFNYAYVNGQCGSIDFRRATPKGPEWLAVLLNSKDWEAELETLRSRFGV